MNKWINVSITTVFVEQPPASPGSAKYLEVPHDSFTISLFGSLSGFLTVYIPVTPVTSVTPVFPNETIGGGRG